MASLATLVHSGSRKPASQNVMQNPAACNMKWLEQQPIAPGSSGRCEDFQRRSGDWSMRFRQRCAWLLRRKRLSHEVLSAGECLVVLGNDLKLQAYTYIYIYIHIHVLV